jgi:hypothetical protein
VGRVGRNHHAFAADERETSSADVIGLVSRRDVCKLGDAEMPVLGQRRIGPAIDGTAQHDALRNADRTQVHRAPVGAVHVIGNHIRIGNGRHAIKIAESGVLKKPP